MQPGDRALASSTMAPLLIAGERNGARFVALAFDIRNSDLPLRVSWPVLVINSVDWFAGEDPAYLSSFKTGETWRIPVAPGVDTAEIETPNGRHLRVPVIEGRAVTHGVQAGFYRLRAGDDSQIIAGNLVDPDESHCAPQPRLDVNGSIASAPVAGRVGVRREIWIYLLAAALGIIVIEWVTYHRRVTV
jgi:hypothetical protein